MLTILVTNTKGGCGKTTIATNLAGAFACAGFITVLADCDRQKSSLGWVQRRSSKSADIKSIDWTRKITHIPKKTQRLIIDAPAALRRKQTEELVNMANMVVVPVLPSVFDENTTSQFIKLLDKLKPIRQGKRAVAVIGNRMRLNTKSSVRLDDFLDGIDHRAIASLRDSQLYSNAAIMGLSIFDINDRRALNFLQDWRSLLSFIDETTVESEHIKY